MESSSSLVLVETAILSAGITAAISAYMLQSSEYRKHGRAVQFSFPFFALGVLLALLQNHVVATSVAIATGWVILIGCLVTAAVSIDVIGIRASLYHFFKWHLTYSHIARRLRPQQVASDFPKKPVSIRVLNVLGADRLERGLSIVLLGDSTTHPEQFAYEIAAEGLSRAENVIYVNSVGLPLKVRRTLRRNCELEERFFLIDCYTPIFGLGEIPITGQKERFQAKSAKGIHTCIRSIRQAIGLSHDYYVTRVVYEDLEEFARETGYERTLKYLLHSLHIENAIGWVSVFLLYENHEESDIGKFLLNQCDCIVRLARERRSSTEAMLSMELVKAPCATHSVARIPYSICWRHEDTGGEEEKSDRFRAEFIQFHPEQS